MGEVSGPTGAWWEAPAQPRRQITTNPCAICGAEVNNWNAVKHQNWHIDLNSRLREMN